MLNHPCPQPYRPRNRGYPKLGPHTSTVQRMIREKRYVTPIGPPLHQGHLRIHPRH
jgi:hypothetical protein